MGKRKRSEIKNLISEEKRNKTKQKAISPPQKHFCSLLIIPYI
jgi:hypothetical protein